MRRTNAKRAVARKKGGVARWTTSWRTSGWIGRTSGIRCICRPADGPIEHLELEQKPAVLHEWVAQLQQRFAGGKIAVALEQRKGAVIHALLKYDCFVLYPINPKALARYREAFRHQRREG